MPELTLTIVYEPDPESDWIISRIPVIPGVMSQGHTREEAREMVLDALALLLSPEPDETRDHEVVRITVH